MDINTLRTAVTVVSFVVFIGIMVWTWSPRRDPEDFAKAANLPFEQD